MRIYNNTLFLFPRSLQLRIFAVCFVGTHLPLFSFVTWEYFTGPTNWDTLLLLLLATLAGTVIAMIGMAGLLRPIHIATASLSDLTDPATFSRLPLAGPDLVGRLFSGVNRAADAIAAIMALLSSAAQTDELTGLLNRRGVLEHPSVRICDGRSISLAIIDIDGFKKINDQFGHPGGDVIMKKLADALRMDLPDDAVIGRWGGEEFIIILPGANEEELVRTVDQMRQSLARRPIALVGGHPITFSGGVAMTFAGDLSVDAAIFRADQALYVAKSEGRNRVVLARFEAESLTQSR
jgi:diguanylate cyclase (GGDEF)-like protein